MIEVRTESPMDDCWIERDNQLFGAAGRMSNWSGAGCDELNSIRDHGWVCPDMEDALALKEKLSTIPDVKVTIREHTSYTMQKE